MVLDAPGLVDPWQPLELPHVRVPDAFYWVIANPVPLAGMRDPRWTGLDWGNLRERNFDCVVCLASRVPDYDPSPLEIRWSTDLEDLAGSWPPSDADSELAKINAAAEETTDAWRSGHGVVVHCTAGIGRTGTVLAIVLSRLGHGPDAAIRHIETLNLARGCRWPESRWHREAIETLG